MDWGSVFCPPPSTTARNLLSWLSSTGVTSCPIGKLPFSFLLWGEFLKTYFLSMPQLSKYVPIRPNERFRKVLQGTWHRQNLHAEMFCNRLRRGHKLTFMCAISSHLGKERSLRVLNELQLGKEKPVMARYGKYWALFGDSKAHWGIK